MPEIVVKLGNKVMDTHALFQELIRVGRSRDNEVVIDHLSVSRRHCEIRFEHGHWLVADLESANGTYVNGQRITTVPLYHADTITAGKVHLHFFDTPVEHEDQNINECDAERTMIVTAPPKSRACLTVVKGKQRGREHVLEAERTLVGRAADCQLQINDWRVAKYHAEVTRRGDGFVIEDLGTWGAILVNGKPVKEHALQEGDLIQLGGTRLVFRQVSSTMGGLPPGAGLGPRRQRDSQVSDAGYRLAVDAAAKMTPRPSERLDPAKPTVDPSGTGPRRRGDAMPGAEDQFAGTGNDGQALLKEMSAILDELDDASAARVAEAASGAQGSGLFHQDTDAGDLRDAEVLPEIVDVQPAAAPESNGNGSAKSPASPEVEMWLTALRSERPALRRHAARQLERLTGQRYDI